MIDVMIITAKLEQQACHGLIWPKATSSLSRTFLFSAEFVLRHWSHQMLVTCKKESTGKWLQMQEQRCRGVEACRLCAIVSTLMYKRTLWQVLLRSFPFASSCLDTLQSSQTGAYFITRIGWVLRGTQDQSVRLKKCPFAQVLHLHVIDKSVTGYDMASSLRTRPCECLVPKRLPLLFVVLTVRESCLLNVEVLGHFNRYSSCNVMIETFCWTVRLCSCHWSKLQICPNLL